MKGSFDMQKLGGLTINSPSSPRHSLEQLDIYILSYWASFDPLYPIIHRGTFNASENRLLAFAMAAIGTQYHSALDVRPYNISLIGTQMLSWTLETMQAVFLIEIFTRFRGRKPSVRCSRQFKELCNRVSSMIVSLDDY
jgi:hypothetical protein